MDWVELGKSFGIPVLLLAAVGYFGVKSLWPFIKGQVEAAQNEGKKEREAFLEALERRDQEFSKIVTELNQLTKSVDGLRVEIVRLARSNEDTKRRPTEK